MRLCVLVALTSACFVSLASATDSVPQPIASVPIDLTDNRIHASFTVEGRDQHLLLDTGASTSLLFESSGITPPNYHQGVAISFPAFASSATGYRIRGLELHTEGFSFTSETTLYISASEAVIGDIGGKFTGILGRDFLARFVVEVVPSEKLMKLYPPGTDLSGHYRLKHDLIMHDGTPYLIHRSRLPWETWPTQKKLLLDTGYPGGVVLWDDTHFDRATKPSEREGMRREKKGVVYFGIVKFGKLLFRNIPVFIGPSAPGQLEDRDGLIGASMFLPFRYVIDLPGEKLLLHPRVRYGGIGFQISNDVIYTPGDEDFVMKDFRPKPSATPVDTYHRNADIIPGE
ncbi:hypothetical protein [Kordiimonas sp.]|uniref:hypothetical protein n=1 Tax=Kordiimonas sp. TaxID=1970157 RepID=UPI003A95AE04